MPVNGQQKNEKKIKGNLKKSTAFEIDSIFNKKIKKSILTELHTDFGGEN